MKKGIKITLIIILSIFIIVATFSVIFISSIMNETKKIQLDKNKIISATKQISIYDDLGEKINCDSMTGSKLIKLGELSDDTINCFLAIEDKTFYSHQGLNYKRMLKALFNNLKSHSYKEGASTISQQLIKNTHLTNEKTLKRKVKEIILTKKLEKSFSKDEILETYLNVIYFGGSCYGIETASFHYFNKSASELTLAESATLAGLIKAPSTYNPVNNYENCRSRRNLVLKTLYNDGYISDEEYKTTIETPITLDLNTIKTSDIYLECVKNEAEEILKMPIQQIMLKNYKIYTYLSQGKQMALKESIENDEFYHKNSYGNIADGLGIMLDSNTAGVTAMYSKSKYDLSNLKRQPGSAIKPILVYSPALEKGEIYNCSMILDEKIDFDGYSPNNVGNRFYGYVSVRDAVAKSLNVPAVKVMDYVGIEKCKSFAKNAGIDFNDYDNGYALALGGFNDGITLRALVNSYVPFVNSGNFIEAKFISKIISEDGIVLYQNNEEKRQIMHDDTAYLMTDLLIDGVKNGTSSRLKHLPYQVAGKTGTVAVKNTNFNSDVYSVAYTSEDIIGVWLGNYTMDEKYNLEGSNNGGTYCTSIINEVFNSIYQNHNPGDFAIPESVIKLKIDQKNLEENQQIALADETCPERYTKEELFSKRFQPTETSTLFTYIDCDFNVDYKKDDNVILLSFTPKDYLIYDVVCNDKLIATIQNTSENQIIEYESLSPNTIYNFSINIKNEYNNVIMPSDIKTIYTKNTYDSLIENQILDNVSSWYFM